MTEPINLPTHPYDPAEFATHSCNTHEGASCKAIISRYSHQVDDFNMPIECTSVDLYAVNPYDHRDCYSRQPTLSMVASLAGDAGDRQLHRSMFVNPGEKRDASLMVRLLPDGSVVVAVNVSNTATPRYVQFGLDAIVDYARSLDIDLPPDCTP